MGILKHGVLPIFSALHVFLVKLCVMDEGLVEMAAPAFGRDTNQHPPTDIEQHLTRALGGLHVALLVNNICAIVQENAHYRGMATLMEAIYFAFDSYSYIKSGRKDGRPIYAMLGLSLIGLGIHAMEPGVFTNDKTKERL